MMGMQVHFTVEVTKWIKPIEMIWQTFTNKTARRNNC